MIVNTHKLHYSLDYWVERLTPHVFRAGEAYEIMKCLCSGFEKYISKYNYEVFKMGMYLYFPNDINGLNVFAKTNLHSSAYVTFTFEPTLSIAGDAVDDLTITLSIGGDKAGAYSGINIAGDNVAIYIGVTLHLSNSASITEKEEQIMVSKLKEKIIFGNEITVVYE